MPPLTQRQERRIASQAQPIHSVDSWDFATTLNSATTSVYRRRILEDMDHAAESDGPSRIHGIFETESGEQESGRHSKAVSWDEDPSVVLEQDQYESSETDALSSSPPDTDYIDASVGISQSPASSATSDSSSPSSFIDSTLKPPQELSSHIPNVISVLAVPIPRPAPSSPHILAASSVSSSSSASVISSSPNQRSFWNKLKSNVRRQEPRTDVAIHNEKGRATPSDILKGAGGVSSRLSGAGRHIRSKANTHTSHASGKNVL